MRTSLSRVCTVRISIAVAAVLFVSGGTESRGDNIPSLQKENGPYMVVAKVFRGPDAEKDAKALASELRQEHKLPAYVFGPFPKGGGHPQETAVLVGDAKTVQECDLLLQQVRRLNPRCLADKPVPKIFAHQPRLARAFRTTNPLLSARRPIK